MDRERLVDVRELHRLDDPRGWFVKVIQQTHLQGRPFGEVYLAVAAPGEARGGHYHKRTTEWFCPVQGRGTLYVASLDGTRHEAVPMDCAKPCSVRVPPEVAHVLVADAGVEFAVLAVADVEYEAEDDDTVPVELVAIQGEPS
jgi:dTDP-4-dehydrorhamnose 3,5-epimerase